MFTGFRGNPHVSWHQKSRRAQWWTERSPYLLPSSQRPAFPYWGPSHPEVHLERSVQMFLSRTKTTMVWEAESWTPSSVSRRAAAADTGSNTWKCAPSWSALFASTYAGQRVHTGRWLGPNIVSAWLMIIWNSLQGHSYGSSLQTSLVG